MAAMQGPGKGGRRRRLTVPEPPDFVECGLWHGAGRKSIRPRSPSLSVPRDASSISLERAADGLRARSERAGRFIGVGAGSASAHPRR